MIRKNREGPAQDAGNSHKVDSTAELERGSPGDFDEVDHS